MLGWATAEESAQGQAAHQRLALVRSAYASEHGEPLSHLPFELVRQLAQMLEVRPPLLQKTWAARRVCAIRHSPFTEEPQ